MVYTGLKQSSRASAVTFPLLFFLSCSLTHPQKHKLQIVFVLNCKMYLFSIEIHICVQLLNLFVSNCNSCDFSASLLPLLLSLSLSKTQIANRICPKLQNVFVFNWNIYLSPIAKSICLKQLRLFRFSSSSPALPLSLKKHKLHILFSTAKCICFQLKYTFVSNC